ncbi:thiol:disulfide interchange protein DsbG [Luteibacter sp. SG786]|uniref:thiol:disulfide interchange protein DsbG n=1 Tax=Luteibacter sp. SG786 TaxID=2587130 RepID=UPI001420DB8D|nr:thiol:disulfide interchange protein DsbG [Luteibacter sp. SG786]NII55800.1 thiol:disulfide interchange protein DsbG [Luteibacter sp. SG786]
MTHPRYRTLAFAALGAMAMTTATFAAEEGRPVDTQAMRGHAAVDGAMKTLSEATWVLDGKPDAPRIIYAFTDPNCPYCHDFWQAARPWVESGKVQIRTLLVGVIREDSPNKAAAILGASDPSAALTRNETTFSQGGIDPVETIPPRIQEQLERNQALMQSLGFRGTPGIVIADADGKPVKANGLPRDGKLEALFGPR